MLAPAVLLLRTGSGWSDALTVAVLVMRPRSATLATICNVSFAPTGSAPIVQTPVACEYVVVPDGVAERNVSPAGKPSVISTPVASAGPLFVAVTVKVTTSPTFGAALSTVFATAMSAGVCTSGFVTVAAAEPLAGIVIGFGAIVGVPHS